MTALQFKISSRVRNTSPQRAVVRRTWCVCVWHLWTFGGDRSAVEDHFPGWQVRSSTCKHFSIVELKPFSDMIDSCPFGWNVCCRCAGTPHANVEPNHFFGFWFFPTALLHLWFFNHRLVASLILQPPPCCPCCFASVRGLFSTSMTFISSNPSTGKKGVQGKTGHLTKMDWEE